MIKQLEKEYDDIRLQKMQIKDEQIRFKRLIRSRRIFFISVLWSAIIIYSGSRISRMSMGPKTTTFLSYTRHKSSTRLSRLIPIILIFRGHRNLHKSILTCNLRAILWMDIPTTSCIKQSKTLFKSQSRKKRLRTSNKSILHGRNSKILAQFKSLDCTT